MKNLILFASITIAAGLLSTNIYNSLVDTRSWGNDIPASIQTTRDYFKIVSPGTFYRVFSPANQVVALLALILFWKTSPAIRLYLGIAFLIYVLNDVLTFAYFYPRNDIMMKTPLADVQKIQKAWMEWSEVNWIRSMMCLLGLAFSFLSLHKIYGLK
jgi:Domain of unknown function (DUF1772)